jgi:hypothetical protein
MHGVLSLVVLVAAFVGLAGWAVFVSLRLYRACSAARARQGRPGGRGYGADDIGGAGEQAGAPHLVS